MTQLARGRIWGVGGGLNSTATSKQQHIAGYPDLYDMPQTLN